MKVLTEPVNLDDTFASLFSFSQTLKTAAFLFEEITDRSHGKFIFYARTDEPNTAHEFIPDPCTMDFAQDPASAARIIALHTLVVSTETSVINAPIKAGDIVLVRLKNHNIQQGELVGLDTPAAIPLPDGACKTLADLVAPENKFSGFVQAATAAWGTLASLVGESTEGAPILLAGDSQMQGKLGNALSRTIGVKKGYAVPGATGKKIASNITSLVLQATRGAVVNFGDNDMGSGVNQIVAVLQTAPAYKTNPQSIVVIGPPPAFQPKKDNPSGMSIDRTNWKEKWADKEKANRKIGAAVEAAGMKFINPYNYLGSVFPAKGETVETKDGVHYERKYADAFVAAIAGELPR
jgi:hypothetical protein